MSNSTNLRDSCASPDTSLSIPPTGSPGPYVAIGPISNFTAAVKSCCSTYTKDSFVSNYAGGSAPQSCYYYCSFNGTVEDMRQVMACQSGAGQEKRRQYGVDRTGFLAIGNHPDLYSKSAGMSVHEVPKLGLWKALVLGFAFFGAMAGTL